MTCLETGEVVKDGSVTILLNTHGTNPQEISPELLQFPEYVKEPEITLKTARDNHFINDLDNIRVLMKNLQWTAEQAMDALGLSAEEQQKYRELL